MPKPPRTELPLVNQDFAVFGPVTSEPLTPLRKIISARMVENKVTLPHVTQFADADMSGIEALRAQFKADYEKAGSKLTPTPFLIKALVETLQKYPKFNASLQEVAETLIIKHYYHIGIAVDTDAGLLVPVLRDADKKSLLQIAKELTEIAALARDRKLSRFDEGRFLHRLQPRRHRRLPLHSDYQQTRGRHPRLGQDVAEARCHRRGQDRSPSHPTADHQL